MARVSRSVFDYRNPLDGCIDCCNCPEPDILGFDGISISVIDSGCISYEGQRENFLGYLEQDCNSSYTGIIYTAQGSGSYWQLGNTGVGQPLSCTCYTQGDSGFATDYTRILSVSYDTVAEEWVVDDSEVGGCTGTVWSYSGTRCVPTNPQTTTYSTNKWPGAWGSSYNSTCDYDTEYISAYDGCDVTAGFIGFGSVDVTVTGFFTDNELVKLTNPTPGTDCEAWHDGTDYQVADYHYEGTASCSFLLFSRFRTGSSASASSEYAPTTSSIAVVAGGSFDLLIPFPDPADGDSTVFDELVHFPVCWYHKVPSVAYGNCYEAEYTLRYHSSTGYVAESVTGAYSWDGVVPTGYDPSDRSTWPSFEIDPKLDEITNANPLYFATITWATVCNGCPTA